MEFKNTIYYTCEELNVFLEKSVTTPKRDGQFRIPIYFDKNKVPEVPPHMAALYIA